MGKSYLSRQLVSELAIDRVILEGTPNDIRRQLAEWEEQYGPDIRIVWCSTCDGDYAELHRVREETDKEMQARIKYERARRERERKFKEQLYQAKIKQYEKLKKELGM